MDIAPLCAQCQEKLSMPCNMVWVDGGVLLVHGSCQAAFEQTAEVRRVQALPSVRPADVIPALKRARREVEHPRELDDLDRREP